MTVKPNSPQHTHLQKVSEEEIREAILDAGGNLSEAARRCGMSRRGLVYRLDQTPDLWRVRDEARESQKDKAESALMSAIERGEAWAVCFFLKCQAKDRGYMERPQIEVDVSSTTVTVSATIRDVVDELQRDPDWIRYVRARAKDCHAELLRNGGQSADSAAGPAAEAAAVDDRPAP